MAIIWLNWEQIQRRFSTLTDSILAGYFISAAFFLLAIQLFLKTKSGNAISNTLLALLVATVPLV